MPNQHWEYDSVHKTWRNINSGDFVQLDDFHIDGNVHTVVKDDDSPGLKWQIEYCHEDHGQHGVDHGHDH